MRGRRGFTPISPGVPAVERLSPHDRTHASSTSDVHAPAPTSARHRSTASVRGPSAARETLALALIVPAALAWRALQVSFDLPLPVWNVVVPLAAVVIVLRWLAGDPLAISVSTPELQQEGA